MIVDVGSGHTRLKIIHPYTNINATFISSAPVKTWDEVENTNVLYVKNKKGGVLHKLVDIFFAVLQ